MRCGVPGTWRTALSTWLPNDWPPSYRLNSGGNTRSGSAADMNSGLRCSAGEDQVAELARGRMVLRQLQVVLDARGLVAGGHAAVHPVGRVEQRPRMADLRGRQDVGNRQQHG